MKKILISLGLMLIILFSLSINVNAFTYKMALEPTKTEVKQGESVEIIINLTELSLAEGEAGILGLEGVLDYDTSVFSKAEVTAESNWKGTLDYTEGSKKIVGLVLASSNELKQAGKIIKVTLTVANDSTIGDTTIKFKNIQLSNGTSATSTTIPDISKTITIKSKNSGNQGTQEKSKLSKIEIAKVPTKISYNEGEKIEIAGMELIATYEDGTTEKITNYEYSPKTELKTTDKTIKITYTENGITKIVEQPITVKAISTNNGNATGGNTTGGNTTNGNTTNKNTTNKNTINGNTTSGNTTNKNNTTKDNTISNKVLSNAGVEKVSTIVFAVIIAIFVVTYINYKKYKNI